MFSRRTFLTAAAVSPLLALAVPNSAIAEPSDDPGFGAILSLSDSMRLQAANYARANVDTWYIKPDNECTIFVSECLWAGGLPQTEEWQPYTWPSYLPVGPGPTPTAVAADRLKNYLVDNDLATINEISWSDQSAGGAKLGDIIGYDWEQPGPDGVLDHLAIVTSFADGGGPNVSQHTDPQLDRYWSWSLNSNNWIRNSFDGYEPRAYLLSINY